MQHLLHDTVADIGRIAEAEGIDCHFDQGGYLSVARNPAQLERVREEVAEHHAWGFGEEDHRLLDAHEVTAIAAVSDALGGVVHPALRGDPPGPARARPRRRRRAARRRRPRAHAAVDVGSRRVVTAHGTVRAEHVVLATEGYTPTVAGRRRALAPIYSLMTATEPLPDATWRQIGLEGARRSPTTGT